MIDFPHIEDYPMIKRYTDLSLQLCEPLDQDKVKDICWKMITYIRPAMEEAEAFNDRYNTASRQLNEDAGIIRPEEEYQKKPLSVSAQPFKRFAIICEKEGDLPHAIWACQQAISLGLTDDGTKAGMKGRLEKLFKRYNEQCQENENRP